MKVVFESERLIYKSLGEEDFEDFCEMDLDPEVMKFYTTRKHGTIEYAKANLQRYLDYQANYPQLGGFMAFDKGDHRFIGIGVLVHLELNTNDDKYEVGYRLPLREWNKGYATEICKAVLKYGFDVLKFNEIYGTTNPENIVSQKVLIKAGLERIGTWSNYGGCTVFAALRPS